MDKMALQDWKSSVVSSKAISSLLENIEKAIRVKGLKVKECPELKVLREKCCDANACTAFAAFQGIMQLIEKKVLIGSQTMSSLISLLPSINHYTPLVMTIGEILLFDLKENLDETYEPQYNFNDKPHPFIIILKHDAGKSWNAIFYYIQYLLLDYKKIKTASKIDMLSIVFKYIFLDPDLDALSLRNDLFDLLLKQIDEPKVKYLIIEILAWQKFNTGYCLLIQKVLNCILHNPDGENKKMLIALMPYFAAAIKWLILQGHNPTIWIDILSSCLEIDSNGSSVILYILSDALLKTPTIFIKKLVDLCSSIIYSSSCNKYVAHKFAATSLIWMVNPSSLAEPIFKTLENVIKFLTYKCTNGGWTCAKDELKNNSYFVIMENSDSDVKMAVEMCSLSDSWNNDKSNMIKWLKNLSLSNHIAVQTELQSFISGIALNENDEEILDICTDILMKISETHSDLSFSNLCLTFFKLSRESEPKRQLEYLQSLAAMAKSKENIPLIIRIIEMLKNGNVQMMWPFVIDLYLKLWRADQRTYPYLHKALFTCSSREESWELNVIKTIALREICKKCPETHGKGLVSKLSDVLNDCDSCNSGIPSAIAIDAVTELCKASVIDINGTWRALKPKLSRDKRTEVIVSLCKLFSEIPKLKLPGPERDGLINDVIPKLWNYAFSTDWEVVKAALRALSKFNVESYGFDLMPDLLKSDIELPKQFCKGASLTPGREVSNELQYIPGECWIELIDKIDSRVKIDVDEMLKSLIEEELIALPRRYFCRPEELPEPNNYSHLPHSSICRAFVRKIQKFFESPRPEENRIPDSVVQILRILSMDYSKTFPCLNWSFLKNFFTSGDECTKYSLFILAKQSPASKTAKLILESYVSDNLVKFNEECNFMFLYTVLPFVCNSLGANSLRQFFDKTIKLSLNSSLNSGSDHFEKVLFNVRKSLESKIILEPRKALLVAQIQSILPLIPSDHKIMQKYAEFAVALPPKTVEIITSPSSWPKVTSGRIRRSIYVHYAVALKPDSGNCLALFNEIIGEISDLPSEQDLLVSVTSKIIPKKRDVNHSYWLSELMWKIQASTSSVNTPKSIKVVLFLLDLFINSSITMAGYDFFLSELEPDILKKVSLGLFPMALFKLLELHDYSPLASKVIDFIHTLSKWKSMPEIYVESLENGIVMMRNNKYCTEKNKWLQLFDTQRNTKCQQGD